MSVADRVSGFFSLCIGIIALSVKCLSDLLKSKRELRKIDRRGYIKDLPIDPTSGWDHLLDQKKRKK
jgi:hypothetical protein